MNDFSFRLNPHTFVRKFPGIVYMENQVSHTRGFFTGPEELMCSSIFHTVQTFSEWNEYWLSPLEREAYGCYLSEELRVRFLQRLHELWLIDILEEPMPLKRDFSYKYKAEIDQQFAEASIYGNMNAITTPWLQNLQIELTDACNERCIHCYLPNSRKDKGHALSTEKVIDVLKQYREMEGLKVVFSGGEILLHKDLFKILNECRSLNLMILLQSNLLTLTPEYLNCIKTLDVFNVQVSLYSTDENIHDSITGHKGSWRKTKRNLELLVENDIPAMISCPVMQNNFSTVRELQHYADGLGVDLYFDYMMMAQSDGSSDNLNARLTLEQTCDMINLSLETKPQFADTIAKASSIEELLKKTFARRWSVCRILSAGMCIDVDGSVYPCPGWNGMKLGHIDSSTLADIWLNSEKTKELRSITQKDFKQCQTCDLHNFCDMCAVYNYNENGNTFHVCHRFCETAHILKKCVINKYKDHIAEKSTDIHL